MKVNALVKCWECNKEIEVLVEEPIPKFIEATEENYESFLCEDCKEELAGK